MNLNNLKINWGIMNIILIILFIASLYGCPNINLSKKQDTSTKINTVLGTV